MRIAYLTSGAGNMYCGSCLHDNRLAAALRAQGRDVLLAALYAPIRTDEEDVSENRVFFGGINIYLQQKSALFRRAPRFVHRLLDSPKLLRNVMRLAGSTAPEELGELTASMLRGEYGPQHRELEQLVEALRVVRPALIHLTNLLVVGLARPLRAEFGIPIICNLSGEDIFLDKLPEPWRSRAEELIRDRCTAVDGFIALTQYYSEAARRRFGLPPERVHVVPPGINLDGYESLAAPPPPPFTIGYMARLCHDKGLHLLCEAFDRLRDEGRNCRLRVAGTLPPQDRAYFEQVRARMTRHGGAFGHLGEVDHAGKLALLGSLHAFSMPTVYLESKGLSVYEALAAGVPVVQPRHGAFPEIIEATGGGLLCAPNDPADLARILAQLMDDAALRARLAESGRRVVRERFTHEVMAERTWAVYEQVVHAATRVG